MARRKEGWEGELGIAFMHNFRFMVGHGHRNKPRVYELAKKRKLEGREGSGEEGR